MSTRDDYEKHRAQILRTHEIARELGIVNDAQNARELVQLEMNHAANYDLACALGWMAYKWVRERNPYYMDFAVVRCTDAGVAPSQTLQRCITDAAMLRLEGAPSGTAEKIRRESAKWMAFVLMMNLRYHGEPLSRAASMAAQWMNDSLGKANKASSLEKLYQNEVKGPGIEAQYFASWSQYKEPLDPEWMQTIDALPEASPELKGERR